MLTRLTLHTLLAAALIAAAAFAWQARDEGTTAPSQRASGALTRGGRHRRGPRTGVGA